MKRCRWRPATTVVYDALYETLVNGQPNYVKESDVLTNMEILERGFEQPSPATITLAK